MKIKASVTRPGKLGKYSRQERLPSRTALAELVKGDPMRRSIGNYAKKTPLDLVDMEPAGIDLSIAPKRPRR